MAKLVDAGEANSTTEAATPLALIENDMMVK